MQSPKDGAIPFSLNASLCILSLDSLVTFVHQEKFMPTLFWIIVLFVTGILSFTAGASFMIIAMQPQMDALGKRLQQYENHEEIRL